jgi:hypothetical protein
MMRGSVFASCLHSAVTWIPKRPAFNPFLRFEQINGFRDDHAEESAGRRPAQSVAVPAAFEYDGAASERFGNAF